MLGDPVEPLGETDLQIGDLHLHLSAPKDIDALLDHAIETAPSDVDAIPYYAWGNRGLNQMLVWIPE